MRARSYGWQATLRAHSSKGLRQGERTTTSCAKGVHRSLAQRTPAKRRWTVDAGSELRLASHPSRTFHASQTAKPRAVTLTNTRQRSSHNHFPLQRSPSICVRN
jgi:hypothetical protein